MAKRTKTFVNKNQADLILPDGTVIEADAEVTLGEAMLANLGVQMWIEAGILAAKGAIVAAADPEPANPADPEPAE